MSLLFASERPADRPIRTTGSRQERNASDYKELMALIKAEGLLARRPVWYAVRTALMLVLFAAAFVALFTLGSSPWVLLLAVGFGLLFTQSAFFAHDGAHRQIFASNNRNEWVSRIVGNGVVGLSYGWWMTKHTRHHANPNKIGKDGDMDSNAIVFTPEGATERAERGGLAGLLMRYQHLFFIPVLMLAGLELHRIAILGVLGRTEMKHRYVEGALLVLRLAGFPALVFIACGPLMGLAFLGIQIAVFGVTMGGSFAPNHKGMAVIPADMDIDFLRRQTLTSRNITGGPLVAVGMGGLNFQIEHHLFPSMPSINLGRARRIVRAYCAEKNVSYTETTFVDSYRIVLRYLKRVGIRHADPFECPIAAQFR
jgi:fatty acid desaturase